MDHLCAAGMFVVNCAILEVQQDNRLLVNLEYTQFIDEEILQFRRESTWVDDLQDSQF